MEKLLFKLLWKLFYLTSKQLKFVKTVLIQSEFFLICVLLCATKTHLTNN